MSTQSTTSARKPRATKATTAAAKPASANPRDDVTLDLDTLEREDRRDPFTFLHDGHVYEIVDPREMDWQEQLRGFGDPIYFLQSSMSKDDVKRFFDTKMPAWKLDKILIAYREHFGLPSLGE